MVETKIIYIDSNLDDAKHFLQLMENFQSNVFSYTNSFTALQKVKEEQEVSWIVFMSEIAAPIQLSQLKSYIDDYKLPAKVIEVLEPESGKTRTPNELQQVTKPLNKGILVVLDALIGNISYTTTTEKKVYSLNYLKDLSQNNEPFIRKMLSTFVSSVGQEIQEMEVAIANKGEEGVKRVKAIAHSLKPSFEMLENTKGKILCEAILYHLKNDEIA